MATAERLRRRWRMPPGPDELLFAPADARSAAVFRVAWAVMLPFAFWTVGDDVAEPPVGSGFAATLYDEVFPAAGYAGVIVVVAALFGAGIRPRFTGLALVGLLLPLIAMPDGRQSRQVLLCAFLAFCALRSDAAWSLRRLRGGPTQASAGPMWPVRLVQLQLTILYLFNAVAKLTPDYLRGDVLEGLSLMRPNFLVDVADGELQVGPFAVSVTLAAVLSVLTELFLAIGFWHPRLRWVAAATGVTFHLALQQVVQIHGLGYASMFLYLAFLLPWRIPGHER